MRLFLLGGLGDHDALLTAAEYLWERRGFAPLAVPLGWQEDHEDPFATFVRRHKYLLDVVARRTPEGEQACIIGSGAGGIMAANMLYERPDLIWRAVAVASPLNRLEHSANPLLNEALKRHGLLQLAAAPEIRRRLLSVRGRKDRVVPPAFTLVPDVQKMELRTYGHAQVIVAAHTVAGGRIARWLRAA